MSNNTSTQSSRPRSKRWYLLPIFFDIIGGIVAYYAVRNDDPKLAKNCLLLGLIVFGISIAFLVGFYEGKFEHRMFTPLQVESESEISISYGASNTGGSCSETSCFNPQVANVYVGDTVTWTNHDSVGHTATSGKPSDNQSGTVFDSSLIAAGKSYTSPAFDTAGTYNYFCQVHPWMTGQIIVH